MELISLCLGFLILLIIFLVGIGLGFWIRHNLAIAEALRQDLTQKIKPLTQAEQDIQRKNAELQMNAVMKSMGLPHEED